MRVQRTRFASGRSMRSHGSPLTRRPGPLKCQP